MGVVIQTEFCRTVFCRQASPELADTISQMLTNHGPLVKVRPSAAVVGIPFKRQGSLDGGQLPASLSGQVSSVEVMSKPWVSTYNFYKPSTCPYFD